MPRSMYTELMVISSEYCPFEALLLRAKGRGTTRPCICYNGPYYPLYSYFYFGPSNSNETNNVPMVFYLFRG